MNDAHVKIYGYDTAEELVGKTWKELYDEKELGRMEQQVMPELLETGQWRGEAIGKRRDGSRYHQEVSLVVTDEGEFVCVVRDITARKQAEFEIGKLNEGLERRVADRTRELSALYDVTALANEPLEMNEALEQLLEYVLTAMGCTTGAIHLLDETEETLRMVVQQGISADVETQMNNPLADSSLARMVIEHGKPLASPNLETDLCKMEAARCGRECAYVSVPVQIRGQAIGVIDMLRETERPFSMEEIALLDAIADHTGVVLENIRLRHKTEETAVIQERQRLARELHDSVTQSVYGMTLLSDAGQRLAMLGKHEQTIEYLSRLDEVARQTLKEVRLLVYELRPLALTQAGLLEALRQRLEVVERRANVDARIVAQEPLVLPADVEETLYRIAQEALNNVLKHSGASSTTVYVHAQDGHVELEIVDNGKGFAPETMGDETGMGLVIMRERAEQLGGVLQVISAPGEGTRVSVRVELWEVSQ